MRKKKPKQEQPSHPFHDFEYDPLKGYEIPEIPYSEEIAQEVEIITDEEADAQPENLEIKLDDSNEFHFD